jgi:RNA ligase (TIGR02306 family)
MRKLVTIRKIQDIVPIKGADRIELSIIDGWECVIPKGKFTIGDVVVYTETDSFIPIKEPFMFLKDVQGSVKKNKDNEEGFKIRVHQMGPKKTPENDALGYVKQTSNGLILPLDDFETTIPDIHDLPIDTDLTERVGAKVFEKFVAGETKDVAFGGMPASVRMTDQERIQNNIKWFGKYHDITFEVTEKIEGTSASFVFSDGSFKVCNRTLDLKNTPGCKHWDYAIVHGIEKAMRDFGKNISLQGELAGEGIEKNHLDLKDVHFFLFDIWDIDKRRYFTPQERKDVFEWFRDACGIEHVPIMDPCASIDPDGSISRAQAGIARLDLDRAAGTVDKERFDRDVIELNSTMRAGVKKFVEMANGDSVVTPGRKREGLVFKSNELVNGQTVSFKVISDAYKIKHDG